MDRRLASPDYSLNVPVRIDDGDGEWQDRLVDDADSQETRLADRDELAKRREFLSNAIRALGERERDILSERRLRDDPTSPEDLAGRHHISKEPRRQIEVRERGRPNG